MDRIVALCRRRGFIFGSSEIYGGIGGFWDYGPLGTELKRNVKDAWWLDMVRTPPPGPNGRQFQMVGLDCAIIMNPKVWEASGHLEGFQDPMVACKAEGCKRLFRADHVFRVGFYDRDEHRDTIELIHELVAMDRGAAERLASSPTLHIPRLLFTVEADSLEEARRSWTTDKLSRKEREFLGENTQTVAVPLTFSMQSWPRDIKCPICKKGTLTDPREFNLMLETHTGAVRDEAAKAYLRPETAQGIFVNFRNVVDTSRVKLPFGIAQMGKSFRNEITPRNYTFRSREFEQYEIEFFCHPSEADAWYEYWRDLRYQWYVGLGLNSDKLRLREHAPDELAHYARGCADVEYDFPFGMSELEGIANRADFDLKAHIEKSGKDLSYFDDQRKERFVPYVIEPSGGVDRSVLAFITEAYTVDEHRASPEFLKFHPRLAPIKAAVFPLVAKDGLPELAMPIYEAIRKVFPCQYEAKQSIGKRYARMDEAGTPFCFTIDGQTKEDGTVTVRDRDTAGQERIDTSRVVQYLRERLTTPES